MELARKPSNHQETKRLGGRDVRGKSKEEQGKTQLERKEESSFEMGADQFGESGMVVMVGNARSGAESFGGDHKAFGGDQKPFGGDHKTFGGDHKEVTSDVLPGVSNVSLSFVSKETSTNAQS